MVLIREALGTDPQLIAAKDKHGCTLLHYAAIQGDHPLVNLLVSEGADVNARNADGDTALGWMAYEGHNRDEGYEEVARILLQNGADPNARDSIGETPLKRATSWARLVDDRNQPVPGAAGTLRGFIRALREHGAREE